MSKSGHVTITKIENLHIAHVEKFTDSKNAILFDLLYEVIAENRFRTVASPWRLWRFQHATVLERSTEVMN